MINKYSNVPLYAQLRDIIIEKIENKEYLEDTQIPSEQELCEMFNISRPTVRQAINELTNIGYLYKEKGKGTFVARAKVKVDMKNYSGFTDSVLDSQVPGNKELVAVRAINGSDIPRLCEIFNISIAGRHDFAETVFKTVIDRQVLAVSTSYIPLNLFPSIIEDINAKKPSYDIFIGKYPLIPAKTVSMLEVVNMDQNDAKYLQIQAGHPAIKIENILYSKNGQPVEYIVSKYRADKCKLCFENVK